MQFFRRNRSPASIGGHESTADPRHYHYRDNYNNFARNHNSDIAVFHAPPAFASDPFTRLDSQPPAHSSRLDDDEPPEGRDLRQQQLAAQQPTVSVVAPTRLNRNHDHSLVHYEAPGVDAADLDQSSVEHSWSSPSPRSSSRFDPEPQNHHQVRQPAKLRKKNLLALHSSSPSPSPSAKDRSKGLGRSFSVKQKHSSLTQPQHQQIVDRRRPSEPYLGFRQEYGVGELHSSPLMQQNTDLDPSPNPNPSSYGLQPATDPSQSPYSHPPPHSPLDRPPSIQRAHTDPLDATHFHHDRRGDSGDLTPSQQSPSRRPSQQPAALISQSGDMAAADRASGLRQPQADSSNPPQSFRRDSQAAPGHCPYPGTPQGASFKGNESQQDLQEHQQGRETPPSAPQSKSREDPDEVDVAALMKKHEELQAKYTKVKRYYFEKEAQVQQLQNTVAHQRMAVSRTVLDDNEYTARFNRLDGAIKDLSFSIRKEWQSIPNWLQSYVNEDAVTVGTKEMTAVGRAVISRWLVDEIFDRLFHPDLEPNLSIQLKMIETNLRRQQPQAATEEDRENQIARISNWRRSTLDGLTEVLQSKSAQDHRSQLTEGLIEKLTASLGMSLKDPPPPDIENGARMIVENALSIAEKIPLEARDICVEYFMPGTTVTESVMKIETGLPALSQSPTNQEQQQQQQQQQQRSERPSRDNSDDVDMLDRDVKESSTAPTTTGSPSSDASPPRPQPSLPVNREQRKKYVFGNFMSKKSSSSSGAGGSGGSSAGPGSSQQVDSTTTRPGSAAKDRDEAEKQENNRSLPTRIRFAAFMAVEVRGKGPNNVLIKAPVYALDA